MATANVFPAATLQEYWTLVDAFERDVRDHEASDRVDGPQIAKSWCEWFFRVYQDLACYLPPPKLRMYAVPLGLRHLNVPIAGRHAAEALVNFLNPSEKLHGEPGVLDTPEYAAIKSAAMSELRGSDSRETDQKQKPHKPKCKYRNIADIAILSAFLQQKHFNRDEGKFLDRALTQEEIGNELGWEQVKVHRCLKRLFQTNRPAAAYKDVFARPETLAKFERELRKNQKSLVRPESEKRVEELLDDEDRRRELNIPKTMQIE